MYKLQLTSHMIQVKFKFQSCAEHYPKFIMTRHIEACQTSEAKHPRI